MLFNFVVDLYAVPSVFNYVQFCRVIAVVFSSFLSRVWILFKIQCLLEA